jgi:hypothetical protein
VTAATTLAAFQLRYSRESKFHATRMPALDDGCDGPAMQLPRQTSHGHPTLPAPAPVPAPNDGNNGATVRRLYPTCASASAIDDDDTWHTRPSIASALGIPLPLRAKRQAFNIQPLRHATEGLSVGYRTPRWRSTKTLLSCILTRDKKRTSSQR